MPTVEVLNGNLEEALKVFKRKTDSEGIMQSIRNQAEFISERELRARKAYRREYRKMQKQRARRRK